MERIVLSYNLIQLWLIVSNHHHSHVCSFRSSLLSPSPSLFTQITIYNIRDAPKTPIKRGWLPEKGIVRRTGEGRDARMKGLRILWGFDHHIFHVKHWSENSFQIRNQTRSLFRSVRLSRQDTYGSFKDSIYRTRHETWTSDLTLFTIFPCSPQAACSVKANQQIQLFAQSN